MKRVVVMGLGIFGFHLTRSLFEKGFEVVAVDKDKEAVNRIRDFSTQAVLAEAMDRELLEMIGVQPEDTVIVSFGEDLAASTLLILYLKEMDVKQIIVKAPNEDHQRVLQKVGATGVIIPEREMAERIAKRLISPNVLDFLPVSEDFTISEVAPPPDFLGKAIGDLGLRKKYDLEVIAVRDVLSDKVQLVPRADFVIKDSDALVVIGREEEIQKIK